MLPAYPAPSPWRIEQFRAAHRVGDIVHGELLSYADHDRAWVRMGQLVVLASIRPGLPPETQLSFRVQSLYPEILLKELQPTENAWADLQAFTTLRQHFEAQCQHEYGPNWPRQLTCLLGDHAKLRKLHAEIRDTLRTMNASLQQGQLIAYQPEILAGLRHSILIFTPALPGTTITEILGYGVLPSQQALWLQTCFTGGQSRTICFAPRHAVRPTSSSGFEVRDAHTFPLRSPWERVHMHHVHHTFEATI